MEADLEETIRMTILQHEVEYSVFEQLSCSRLENFWLEWRGKMKIMATDLRQVHICTIYYIRHIYYIVYTVQL